jgi:hypothetical protein
MRIAPLLALLALAGCSWFRDDRAGPPPETRPEYLACQREVRDSPEMRALAQQTDINNAINTTRIQAERGPLQSRLYRECLRRRGLALPGGVEPLRNR